MKVTEVAHPTSGSSGRISRHVACGVAEDARHSRRETRFFCVGRVGGGILTVRFTVRGDAIRIFGAGYWRRGKEIYEQENQIHG